MADQKISELVEKTTPIGDDLLAIVDTEASPDETKKIKTVNLLAQIPVHGAVQHTDITREIFLPACEGHFSGAAAAHISDYSAVLIADGDVADIYMTMKVPVDFVSFTSVKVIWVAEVAVGNMYWYLSANYAACGEHDATHSDNPVLGVTATGGAGITNCQEPANALTLASLAVGDLLGIHFLNVSVDPSDTLDADRYIYGLLFTYVANQ